MTTNRFRMRAAVAALFLLLLAATMTGAEEARTNPLEGDMVSIPAGHFVFGTDAKDEAAEALSMGIPKPWYADENPAQKIFLKGFYIDRHEVTNQRYKIYVDDVGAVPPMHWKDENFPEGQAQHPVIGVNWFDAANFCQWAGKSLPTEKQWERAARGTDGQRYPWGNAFDPAFANLPQAPGSRNQPGPVGAFTQGASPDGVQDLIGNVWEWVDNEYKAYKGAVWNNESFDAGYKVIRGHSARDIGHFPGALYGAALEKFARSGYRQFAHPDEPAPDVGFRCVSAEKPAAMAKNSLTQALTGNTASPTGSSPSGETAAKTGSPPAPSTPNPFQARPNLPQSGLLVLTLLAFIAGVFSFLSPCTLPILPAYFAITAQTDRTRMGLMSLAFFFGLATLFVAMGASASLIGQVLRDYMFSLATIGGILVALFGVMTLFGKGFSGANFQGRPASTFFGFFLFGATFALGWTPASDPFFPASSSWPLQRKPYFRE